MMSRGVARPFLRAIVAAGFLITTGACAAAGQAGKSSAYLVVESLLAASGANPGEFGGTLASDVITSGGILEDPARATFRLVMKDPALATSPVNWITLRGYRVSFSRTDGRNRPGIDVPHAFDGALTATISETQSVDLVLVRAQAKLESPLRALVGAGGAIAIATFADVIFYGADQAGNDVTVSARISVTFADWGDEG